MKKGWLGALVVGLSLVLLLAVSCASAPPVTPVSTGSNSQIPLVTGSNAQVYLGSSQQVGIFVNGQGKVTVVPDLAVLSLGVEAQAKTVAEARAQAAAAMDAIMKALAADGVATKDIQTQQFNIYPVKTYNKEQTQEILIGYRVSNTITVNVRKVEDAGRIIDDTVLAGGDLTRFNGVYLTVDKPETYFEQARENAIKDAIAKAKQMATLTNVTLGKPISISESSGGFQPIYKAAPMAGIADREATTPITPGETDINVSVQITFAIQ